MATPDQPYFAEGTYTKLNIIYENRFTEWNGKYTGKGGLPISVGECS